MMIAVGHPVNHPVVAPRLVVCLHPVVDLHPAVALHPDFDLQHSEG